MLQSLAPEEKNACVPLSTYKPLWFPTPAPPKLRTNPEYDTHCIHATRVLGALPDGTAVVDPVYVRYAPPDKTVAKPGWPQWSGAKVTPDGFDTVNPAVEDPAKENTGATAGMSQQASHCHPPGQTALVENQLHV